MVSRSISAVLVGALTALTVLAGPAAATPVTTLHASPGGSGARCSADSPCSITQAQKKVRELAPRMRNDIVVSLRGGTYELAAPLTFTADDSGTGGHQVRWESAKDAVISGGVPISGWQKGAGNLWSAKAPKDLRTRQVYADGVRLPRANGTTPVALTQTPTGYQAADTSMASWRNPGNLEFVLGDGHGSWSEPRCSVAGISGTAITMRQPCWDNMKLPDGPRGPYGDNPHGGFPSYPTDAVPTVIENAFELLSDGEWYLDETADVLYYQARPTDDPRRMKFTAAKLEALVRTATTADAPLHDVTFQGLEFAYATWMRPASDDGFVEMQANFTLTGPGASKSQGLCNYSEPKGTCPFASWTRPSAAVDLVGTKNVKFLRNTFQHLGGAGLGFQHGATDNLVQGNTITDVSGIGILLGAVDDPQPAAENLIATGNTIDNNYLHRTGVEFTGAPSIVNGYSRKTTITHNEIGDVPYSGISSGWGGWRTNSTFPDENPNINGDNVISYNLVYRDMLVRYDGGAVYTNGPQGKSYEHGLTIQGNVNFSGRKTANSIYNDEGGDYVTITGNVQYNDNGGFNGGCSTTGHLRRKDNYRVGTMNSFGCAPGPVGVEDLGGNKLVGQNPQAGEIPNAVLAQAGLRSGFRDLSTSSKPVVALASPTCTDDILISGSGFTEQSKVTIGGVPARPVTFVSSSHLTVKLPQNSTGGAVSVTTKSGTSAVDVDAAATLCRGLSTTASNVGVSSDSNTRSGNVDGFGYTFSAEALASKGVVPGGPVRWNGITYTWPTASPGTPDNTLAAGQTVGLIGSSSALGFLLTSTYATSGTGTVNYTDGTSQSYTVGAPNWAGTLDPGVTPVITTPYRNGPDGRDNRDVYVFAAEVELDPAKTVKSVKLPDVGSEVGVGVQALHIFSVALAGSPNLAQHKNTSTSSEGFGAASARVVDGDTNGVFNNNSVSHTNEDQFAWWQVDLGAVAPISTINVWNRTDCCTTRLDDHWVFVSSTPFDTSLSPTAQAAVPGVWSSHHTGAAPVVTTLKPGASGRYVMVQLSKKDYLTLAEVEVYGGPVPADGDWVGTWGTAQAAPIAGSQGWFTNETVRNVVHTSVGGTAARVRFSNKFGTGPLVLDKTSIALRSSGASAVEGSVRALTFGGRSTVTIPAGGSVRSDPLDFAVPADSDLLISTHSTQAAGPVTYHPSAQQTSYLSWAGDFTTDTSGAKFERTTGSWFYVEEVDVRGSQARGSVVALGDSITDGGYSTTDANHRWPDYLADRLGSQLGVLNSGISANRLLRDGGELAYGRSALARLDDDVLSRTGVRSVIVLEGVNDLHQDPRQTDPEQFIAGYKQLVERLHAKGIKVFGATITPIKGWGSYTDTMETTRGAVNDFIRTNGVFDGVLDFDAALRDPADPLRLKAEYDSGDHLHPSDAGNAALAAAVDLSRL
jgi:lysophospholipase L1-like esterase